MKYKLLVALSILCLISCGKKNVSLIVKNAKIYTVDSAFTTVQAMAINDGKIIATGTDSAIESIYSSAKIIDAAGKTIFPGFIDAHCHFTGYATDMWKCSLMGTTSFEEIVAKVKTYSSNAPMEWIYGRGWDQNDWAVKSFPKKAVFDSMFPNRPVFLKRVDGHAALLNQKALDLAGININTKIAGGEVEIKDGKLTGMLIDNAMGFAEKVVPLLNDTLAKKYFNDAQNYCFAAGLTGVHDCGISEHTVDLVLDAQKNNGLKMKIYGLLSDDTTYYEKWAKSGPMKTERFTVGGFKFYSDGALGSRGACLLNEYSDKKAWLGFLLNTKQHFENAAKLFANTTSLIFSS